MTFASGRILELCFRLPGKKNPMLGWAKKKKKISPHLDILRGEHISKGYLLFHDTRPLKRGECKKRPNNPRAKFITAWIFVRDAGRDATTLPEIDNATSLKIFESPPNSVTSRPFIHIRKAKDVVSSTL